MNEDPSDQIAQRRAKLTQLRQSTNAYPNDFRRDVLAVDLHQRFAGEDGSVLEHAEHRYKVAGRLMSRRIMGKASFAHLQDMSGQIQLYLRRDQLPEGRYETFKQWDIGDILGATGSLFKTRTGELSLLVEDARLLTKALRPLPEKFHGLADQESKYRQRYLDLIMNEPTRKTFQIRSAVIDFIRDYLKGRGFLEVETPMMQAIPGGAVARPFKTYHNSLNMGLYLRIAPELYLKRLLVGGFEQVFEINRNFRNEGLSTKHNPEFTMLEFYEAYADHATAMDRIEDLLRSLAKSLSEHGRALISFQGAAYDLSGPFERITLRESILKFNPDVSAGDIDSIDTARVLAGRRGATLKTSDGLGKVQTEIFEKTVEPRLSGPVFVTAFPAETSPLARRNDQDPFVTDRFELFIAGREIANGFSELNDPEDQAQRFTRQVQEKDAGDEEAMHFDQDYIVALEHGMPPAAGVGLGIDRLVMLLADAPSIRDVLLFPQLRPKEAAGSPGEPA
ncbi:MAG: lysine--tRNA ligase [Gammaproteobacteria bacterium]